LRGALIAAAVSAAIAAGTAGAATQLVTSAQIKNGTIRLQDMNANTIKALKGQRGPQGEPGLPGLDGANGGFDPAKVTHVVGARVTIPANGSGEAFATCPAGSRVLGGGFYTSIAIAANSSPTADGSSGWWVIVNNFDNVIPVDVQAEAVCALP
jgi:hypothetical protein